MSHHRKLPLREQVFAWSLMYHGYRRVHRRTRLKKKRGYIIPATNWEDATGIDFMIKPRGETRIVPVQITQRGVALYRKHHFLSSEKVACLVKEAEKRIREKRIICKRDKVLFIVVRDYNGQHTNERVALSDIKALRFALARFKH
jgi:hypothetical protein